MMNDGFHSAFDATSVSVSDLREVVDELNDKQLLGRLTLNSEKYRRGFLLISPALTAELMKTFATLPSKRTEDVSCFSFAADHISFRIFDGSFLAGSELAHISKLASLAGFDRKYKNGSSFEFRSRIEPSEEHFIYAISKNRLRDIFRMYFPQI